MLQIAAFQGFKHDKDQYLKPGFGVLQESNMIVRVGYLTSHDYSC